MRLSPCVGEASVSTSFYQALRVVSESDLGPLGTKW